MPDDAPLSPAEAARRLVASTGAPGAAAGLLQAGEIRVGVAGCRAVSRRDPMEPGDAIGIGALTQAMTACLVLRLEEAGIIRPGDTIGSVLGPSIPGLAPRLAAADPRAFLGHRSGLRAAPDPDLLEGLRGDPAGRDLVADRRAITAGLLVRGAGRPGRHRRSDPGHVILAAMLEAMTGSPWEELVAAEVLRPLGLVGAGFGTPPAVMEHERGLWGLGAPRLRPRSAATEDPPALGPAGNIHLPPLAMMRFLAAHAIRDRAYLSPASWDILHGAAGGDPLLPGWQVRADGVLTGRDLRPGFQVHAALRPGGGAAAFLAVNVGPGRGLARRACDLLARLLPPG